ncbi:unnamed protein product, partial [Bubo scandiacus]
PVKTMVKQVVPLQTMEDHTRADICNAAHGGPHTGASPEGSHRNRGAEVRPHQCRVQGQDHFPVPAGHAISDTSRDTIGLLGHL